MTEMKNNQQADKEEIILTQHNSVVESNIILAVEAQENGVNDTSGESSFVIRTPRADSKLILQNMEEVLNSVKKKHRAKHKRKRELKKQMAQMEATGITANATANISKIHNKDKRHEKKLHKKKPLQVTQDNQDVSPNNSNSILHHFMRTPKKDEKHDDMQTLAALNKQLVSECEDKSIIEIVKIEGNDTLQKQPAASQPLNKTNAFEVMMNARNKSIGSNASGRESMPAVDDNEHSSASNSPMLVKRKLLLQNLAERKGAAKRKLDEETRAAYVIQTLGQRAKRLKNMLERTVDTSSGEEKVLPKTDCKTRIAKKNKDKNKRYLRSQSPAELSNAGSVVEVAVQHPTNSNDISRNLTKSSEKSDDVVGETLSPLGNNNKSRRRSRRVSKQLNQTDKEQNNSEYINVDVLGEDAEDKQNIIEHKNTARAKNDDSDDDNNDDGAKEDEKQLQQEQNSNIAIEVENINKTRDRPRRSCINRKRIDYIINDISPVKKSPRNQQLELQQQHHRRSKKVNEATAISTPISNATNSKLLIKKNKKKIQMDIESNIDDIDEIIKDDDDDEEEEELLDEIINVDESLTPRKLAPLFTRQVPKPAEDPHTIKARRAFLRSGVPEKVRIEQNRIKQYEQNYEESWQLYPNISHVQQYNESDHDNNNDEKKKHLTNKKKLIAFKDDENNIDNVVEIKQKFGLITNCRLEYFNYHNNNENKIKSLLIKCNRNVPLALLPAKRLVVKSWKLQYDRFPTYKCYNQLREKYRYFSALDTAVDTQQVNDAFMVTRVAANITTLRNNKNNINNNNNNSNNQNIDNDENSQPPATAPNGELLFTEKYKPLLFEQILVNLTPVVQLREFLSNWCSTNVRNNDADDFTNSFVDDSWSHNSATINSNTVVLLGPRSSGKTNAVFALANELNFNVLEINAGMKRTGKRLVQELHEATQSHQIIKESIKKQQQQQQQQRNLMQISLNNGRKTRASKTASPLPIMATTQTAATSSSSSFTTTSTTDAIAQRKCLILIEDADIAFEQTDAGFIDAIYTLAAASKRPVIIVASNPNCSHLQRLMQQQSITFNLPHVISIARYLAILSLIENCPISIDDIVSLYLYNGMDVRRTLLEMQLFVQSGGDMHRPLTTNKTTSNTLSSSTSATESMPKFIASPTKAHMQQQDLERNKELYDNEDNTSSTTTTTPLLTNDIPQAINNIYIHQTLFNFYTLDQNTLHRIPYPVDFTLLNNNLSELLQKSPLYAASCNTPKRTNFVVGRTCVGSGMKAKKLTPNKTCSPKKAWLNTVSSSENPQQEKITENWHAAQTALCEFYEHISVAAIIDAHDMRCKLIENEHEFSDLSPRIAADMTHTLVEQAIKVNLCAEPTAYNLFHNPKSQPTLCNYLNTGGLRGTRATCLDWEPALRKICRQEQQRASEERKSTRFYHYLRNSCSNGVKNFSTDHFDNVCTTLQTQED